MALPKEKVAELLKNVKPKEESSEDKLLKLLETVKGSDGSDNMLPFMLMAMNSGKSGGDGLERVYYMKAMRDLFDDGKDKFDIKDVIRELDERTSQKLERFEEKMLQLIEKIAPKPESETDKLLKQLLAKVADGKGDKSDVNTVIELAKIFKGDNQKDPVDIAIKLHEMNKDSLNEVNKWKERYYTDKNEATQKQLEQALQMIQLNQNNNDFMSQLHNATETLDKFKSFATQSGLIQQPDPNATKEGKLDWKYIMKTITDVVGNVAPMIRPPEQKSNWNLEAEADKVFKQYKDTITRQDGTPIDREFVKQELIKNPNVSRQWDMAIEEAMAQSMRQNNQQPPAKEEQKATEPKEEEEEIKEPEEVEEVKEIKGRSVEPNNVG